MRLGPLLAGFAPVEVGADVALTGLTVDSRAVQPGQAFVALSGTRRHGLAFAAGAVARGATAILFEPAGAPPAERWQPACAGVPAVPVPALSAKLGAIAGRFHGEPSRALDVFGVTGTNGKSSFVRLLGRALAVEAPTGTLGTLGVGMVGREAPLAWTTPDAATVQALLAGLRRQGARRVVMEVSSHALDQGRVNGVLFRGAAFTNLSRDHLDYHGTMERYTAAKARLMTAPGLQFAILNAEDARVQTFRDALHRSVRRIEYGVGRGDVRAEALRFAPDGTRFSLRLPTGREAVRTRLLGRFNVMNALAVAATLHALDWSPAAIAGAIAASEPVPGRMQAISRRGRPLVVVDYAHTPDALAQCLAGLREHAAGQRILCVFGCGGERDRGKRPEMGAIAERLADRVILTDDNPRCEDGDAIVAEILAGVKAPERILVRRDRAAAIALAVALGGEGDVVVVAGKGHERYQEIGAVRTAFDDREAARAALEDAPC